MQEAKAEADAGAPNTNNKQQTTNDKRQTT